MKRIPNPKKMNRVKGPALTKQDLVQAKVRVTTFLDKEVLENLRKLAQDSGSKYQSILNQILRDYLFGQKKGLVARLSRLEAAVFQK